MFLAINLKIQHTLVMNVSKVNSKLDWKTNLRSKTENVNFNQAA